MSRRYDLIAVGGGTTGLVATLTAAGLGARTALIERDRPGGGLPLVRLHPIEGAAGKRRAGARGAHGGRVRNPRRRA